MDALEKDTLEVLRLIQSARNSFAPISRIPPEVLSTIPDYCREGTEDRVSVALTHVCRDWRETFISRSSLWTRLDLTNTDKTRTYIQRSQSSPLKVCLESRKVTDDAFTLIIPHTHRLESLTINARALPTLLFAHFRCHMPLLAKLDINIAAARDLVLDGALFSGDLSSLSELHLGGVITNFPWTNLANLRVVSLRSYSPQYSITQLLDFFESAPLLHTVELEDSIQRSSDAPPPARIVPLRHLKAFTINADPPHSILLRHLHIPVGASLISKFYFRGEESPLLDYLSGGSQNFGNLSHITVINLTLDLGRKFARLSGPSGSLRVRAVWRDWRNTSSSALDRRIFHSLGHSTLSTTQRLVISHYGHQTPAEVEECPIFQTLSSANELRTLVMINCNNRPFACALDPEQNSSNLTLCSKMEELVVYIKIWYQFDVEILIRMTKNRASRGAKLSSITFVDLDASYGPRGEVFKLREHVTHVEYRVEDTLPAWDIDIPGDDSE